MPLHESALPPEVRDLACEQFNARLGLILFAIYFVGYAAFVIVCAVSAKAFDAVLAGMMLIAGAMVISLVYAQLCRAPKGSA